MEQHTPLDLDKCIICQKETREKLNTADRGRKRIRETSKARDDIIYKRIKSVPEDAIFFYHLNYDCYRKYTHHKNVERESRKDQQQDIDNTSKRKTVWESQIGELETLLKKGECIDIP